MKLAIIGSRNLTHIDIGQYIPLQCREIVSGGARGVDTIAAAFAQQHNLLLTVFPPDYTRYGRAAPIVRNKQIVDYADEVLAFWDGISKGTLSVIQYCKKTGKECRVIHIAVNL